MDAKSKRPVNPYLAARNEWNERYGSYIAQRNVMAIFTLCALLVAILAVAGVIYIGSQSKFVPYIVAVDDLGRSVGVGVAQQAAPPTQKMIKAQLAEFIRNVRSVTSDRRVQKTWLKNAYAMMDRRDPAGVYIQEYFGGGEGPRSPYIRAATETVGVDVSTILALSGESWEIEWIETVRDKQGAIIDTLSMRGLFQIRISAPETEDAILKNPAGVFIKAISWSEKLR